MNFSPAIFLLCIILSFPGAVFSALPAAPLPTQFLKQKPTITPTYFYQKPFHIPQDVWDRVKPYFLPNNHPIKAKLDAIFGSTRVLLSLEGFKKAGFSKYKMRSWSRAVVAQHPKLQGVIIKAYLDTELEYVDWERWLARIEGAQGVQACIARHGYENYFSVPAKWIYPLPDEPVPPLSPKYSRKNFILIAEKMKVLKKSDNLNAWRTQMTPELLDAIYIVLTEEGLFDSLIASNIPFTKDGRMSFIDTEHHHGWPINYSKMAQYLSPPMQLYWNMLITNNGPMHKRARS